MNEPSWLRQSMFRHYHLLVHVHRYTYNVMNVHVRGDAKVYMYKGITSTKKLYMYMFGRNVLRMSVTE